MSQGLSGGWRLLADGGHRAGPPARGGTVRAAQTGQESSDWGHELEPKPSDAEAIRAWKQRMASEEGQKIYQQRAATSETGNADLRTYRGLVPLTVRGLDKIKCVALWCALAYNLTQFSKAFLS
jgi:hypothetical protein